jgi:hypothetical protein
MNEVHERPQPSRDDSGVFLRGPMQDVRELANLWDQLEPTATHEPEAVRSLHDRIAALLSECMTRLTALECMARTERDPGEIDELLDASYVLERLEWCVLHRVPYVERPRVGDLDG